jgi:very-short-patch-repair endonuclease
MAASAHEPVLDLDRPFTHAQGLAAGLTSSELRGRGFRRILHGVYIRAAAPLRPFERVEAALVLHTDTAYASHTSAARVYRLPVPERLSDEHVSVFRKADRRSPRGVCPHLAPTTAGVFNLHGIRLSAPVQVFLEMATLVNLVELVVIGDALVRQKRVSPEQLVAAAAAFTGRGAVLARRAASFVRRGVDSAMETRLRMLIVLAGLPEPQVNFKIYYSNGELRYRFDLSYPALLLAVEYDGRQHRDDLDQWDSDLDRDDWLDDHEWRMVKVFSRGIYKEPARTLERVRKAIVSRGGRVPRRLRDDWKPFFPVTRPPATRGPAGR